MMEKKELLSEIARSVTVVVHRAVSAGLSTLAARIESLEARLNTLPPARDGKDGKDIDPELVRLAIVGEVTRQVAEIPPAMDGERGPAGKDGVSITTEEFKKLIIPEIGLALEPDGSVLREWFLQIVRSELSHLPLPKDGPAGKDADPDAIVETILKRLPAPIPGKDADPVDIEAIVAEVVKRIPPGQPGKDANPEDVRAIVREEILKIPPAASGKDAEPVDIEAVAELVLNRVVTPRDGKDADPEEIRRTVLAEIAKIPPANPGKDADPVDVDAIVAEVLKRIPPPIPGKDADPVDVDAIVAEVLKRIPLAKDGKDADPVDMKALQSYVDTAILDALTAIPPAKDGKDADPVDIDAIVETVLKQIPVPKDGKDVHPDTVALLVHTAIDKRLEEIPRPKDGERGEPGKDAMQLQILPIDLTKSYPSGSYVACRGSILRSFRQTDVEPDVYGKLKEFGWEVIVTGMPDVDFQQHDDLRTFSFKVRSVDGFEQIQTFKAPVVIFRGVWREGNDYSAGDEVSLGGSTWHCNVDNCKSKPSTHPTDWTMATKRGQDGKDLRPSEVQPHKPVRLS